jgi:hypothetical protein
LRLQYTPIAGELAVLGPVRLQAEVIPVRVTDGQREANGIAAPAVTNGAAGVAAAEPPEQPQQHAAQQQQQHAATCARERAACAAAAAAGVPGDCGTCSSSGTAH